MGKIEAGEIVSWKWLGGFANIEVIEIRNERTDIFSKGRLIVRDSAVDNPAVVVSHKSGNEVIKLQSELQLDAES